MATTAWLFLFTLVVLVGPISSHPNLLSTALNATAADHRLSTHNFPDVVRANQKFHFWKILVGIETIVGQNFAFWLYFFGKFSMNVWVACTDLFFSKTANSICVADGNVPLILNFRLFSHSGSSDFLNPLEIEKHSHPDTPIHNSSVKPLRI